MSPRNPFATLKPREAKRLLQSREWRGKPLTREMVRALRAILNPPDPIELPEPPLEFEPKDEDG